MKGSLFLRGNTIHFAYYEEGRAVPRRGTTRLRVPAGCKEPTKTEAWRKALKVLDEKVSLEKAARQGRATREPGNVVFGELLDGLLADAQERKLKGLRQVVLRVGQLRAEFGARRAKSLRKVDFQSFARKLQSPDRALSVSSVNRLFEHANSAFSLFNKEAAAEGRTGIPAPMIPRLPVENARQGFVEPKDFKLLLAAIPDPDFRDFVEWLGWTGMREGEAASLKWEDFDESGDHPTITLRAGNTKSQRGQGQARVIPCVSVVAPIIARRKKERLRGGSNLIFFFESGTSFAAMTTFLLDGKRREATKGGLRDRHSAAFERAAKEIGKPELTPHDLRRSAVRNLTRAGVPRNIAKLISGHKTDSVFERYNIVDEADVAEALKTMGSYVDQKAR